MDLEKDVEGALPTETTRHTRTAIHLLPHLATLAIAQFAMMFTGLLPQ